MNVLYNSQKCAAFKPFSTGFTPRQLKAWIMGQGCDPNLLRGETASSLSQRSFLEMSEKNVVELYEAIHGLANLPSDEKAEGSLPSPSLRVVLSPVPPRSTASSCRPEGPPPSPHLALEEAPALPPMPMMPSLVRPAAPPATDPCSDSMSLLRAIHPVTAPAEDELFPSQPALPSLPAVQFDYPLSSFQTPPLGLEREESPHPVKPGKSPGHGARHAFAVERWHPADTITQHWVMYVVAFTSRWGKVTLPRYPNCVVTVLLLLFAT